jgi:hypothetical protein
MRAHLVQDDRHACFRDLPGRLAAGKAATNNMDGGILRCVLHAAPIPHDRRAGEAWFAKDVIAIKKGPPKRAILTMRPGGCRPAFETSGSGVDRVPGSVFDRTAVETDIGKLTIRELREDLDVAAIAKPRLDSGDNVGEDHCLSPK